MNEVTFNDTSENGLAIQKATVRINTNDGISISLELCFQSEDRASIIDSLAEAGVDIGPWGAMEPLTHLRKKDNNINRLYLMKIRKFLINSQNQPIN